MTGARGASIVLLTGNSLCSNPRALKEATALARAGYDVAVFGAWLQPDLKSRDSHILKAAPFRFVPVLDCTQRALASSAPHAARRVRSKAANLLHGLTGWESTHQLGPLVASLWAHARGLEAGLFIAHSEPALYVACRLMAAGCRVGVDMEDWFSEDLLPQARRRRPLRLLRRLERELVAAGAYASCPSRAMSEALAAEYGCRRPTLIYNAFPLAERAAIDGLRKDRRDAGVASIHWYSQTIGRGRGLEDLADALALLDRDIEVHLRGRLTPGMEEWFRSRIPERSRARVFFHPPVSTEELLSRIAEHDIGFAGELLYCRNKDLTVSNKILHYLLGGLAVVASNTAGQREVGREARGAVELYEPGNPKALARTLLSLLGSPERLRCTKAAAVCAAERTFCWEKQEPALLTAVAAALTARLQ
jgi:hypothetical protein